ncbi:alpha-glucosidase-like [Limulus polyphemus]|uniref:Alpha-glucosidase-like n=1 Tax=Limulus polyphemus TaxID=6850 RepID=A0ABM1BUE4_LIMPO|nr:alpha-glucosidase-like [Limulus polyphemus]
MPVDFYVCTVSGSWYIQPIYDFSSCLLQHVHGYSGDGIRYPGLLHVDVCYRFPRDKVTLDIDYQFLWGSALLISPAVFKGQTEIKAYFPSGNWFDFYTGKKIKSAGGRHISLEAPMYKINLHIRGGHILPLQQCNLTIKDR